MAIDKMMTDPMLNPFRAMVQECIDKNIQGESFDKMQEMMNRMEQLAEEMDDIGAYSIQLTTEGIFTDFSTYYGKALTEAASAGNSEGADFDDKSLLQQNLDALKDSVKRIKEGKEQAMQEAGQDAHKIDKLLEEEKLIKPIEELIALGESGVSYPVFLRLQIEKGLDKAMEGAVVARDALLYDVDWAKASMMPYPMIEMREKILAKFDEMASKATFNVPDSFVFGLERQKIEHEFAPAIAQWEAIKNRWETMLSLVHDWVDAHIKQAPYDDRFLGDTPSITQKNIRRVKECNQGELKVREQIFNEYFGLTWEDIFSHESFQNEVNAYRIPYSSQRIDFLKKVYPHCNPFQALPAELVQEAEEMYEHNQNNNPDIQKSLDKIRALFDEKFGVGEFDKTY